MDQQGARRNILVVDDDEDIRDTLRFVLQWEGFAVSTAGDGHDALNAIARQSPDVVLLDVVMPVLDGRSVAREIRQRGLALPIIIMSAGVDAQRSAEEIGAVAYLDKPFSLEGLIRALHSALGGSRGRTMGRLHPAVG